MVVGLKPETKLSYYYYDNDFILKTDHILKFFWSFLVKISALKICKVLRQCFFLINVIHFFLFFLSIFDRNYEFMVNSVRVVESLLLWFFNKNCNLAYLYCTAVLKIWFLLFLCYKPLSLRKEIDTSRFGKL